MKIKAIKTRIFKEKEDLPSFIFKYVKNLPEKSILVVTSKIVALAEGRIVEIDPNISHKEQREKIIKEESDLVLKTKLTYITVKGGELMTSAGIDESNANGKIILLPKDSFRAAKKIRNILGKKYKIKNLGVIIVDSRKIPTKRGIMGVAIGYAGVKGLKDTRGQNDIFGRILQFTRSNTVDSIAATAVLCMGEGKEKQPLALVTGAPVEFAEKINNKELIIDPREDIYQPLFEKIKKTRNKK